MLISPRLQKLAEELNSHKPEALSAFWQEVGQRGAPMIEALEHRDQVLVTFLWQAQTPVEKVKLIRGLTQHDPARADLFHLPNTDLWYRTFQARADTRAFYLFRPDDSATRLDPFNTKTYRYHPQSPTNDESLDHHGFLVSVLELPQAPAQPWIHPHPNTRKGHVEQHLLHSALLNNKRSLWVYTPADYQTTGVPYALLILFDAWAYVFNMQITTTLDNLISVGKIPPVVAVILDSPDRMLEFLCHPLFADFLAQELIPWIHQYYHVTNASIHTVVGGLSAGGLAAAYTGFCYPNIFGNVLAQSAALWWRPESENEPEWLARQFARSPRLPLRFYLEVGLLEDWIEDDEGVSQLVSTRHFCDILQTKGYAVQYAEFSGDHDEICWQGTVANGLITLFNNDTQDS